MAPSRKYCCIKDCRNAPYRLREVNSGIKFYSFPKSTLIAPWKNVKRAKWIRAVKNYVKNPTDWEPVKDTVICSAHFVGNKKSEHPQHPAYLPTIFPGGENQDRCGEQALRRFERLQRRTQTKFQASVNRGIEMERCNDYTDTIENEETREAVNMDTGEREDESSNISKVTYRSITCQTEEGISYTSDEPSYFICNLTQNNGVCTAEVQVNIRTKIMVDKVCDVNLPIVKDTKDFGCDPIVSTVLSCSGFHGLSSIKNDDALSSLAGVTFATFTYLLSILPDSECLKIHKTNKLLITLMKLKTGLTYTALAVLFNIHRTSVQRIFVETLQCLNVLLKNSIFWPSKTTVEATLPDAFKKNYPATRVIIDCTEVKTEIPSNIKERVLMYSDYKHHHTIKFLVGCTPNGFVCFLSKCYGGRSSDCFITNDCGIIDLLEPGDIVLADKGFPSIRTSVEAKNAIFIMPPFLHDSQFTSEEVDETYNIASVRIHIERIMQRIKEFNILTKIPISLFPHVDEIVFVICALINFEKPIIKQ